MLPGDVELRWIVLAALIVASAATSAHAQTTQVWPEISAFTRLNDRMRGDPNRKVHAIGTVLNLYF